MPSFHLHLPSLSALQDTQVSLAILSPPRCAACTCLPYGSCPLAELRCTSIRPFQPFMAAMPLARHYRWTVASTALQRLLHLLLCSQVRITPKKGKAILISGHDLQDTHDLLAQTEGKGEQQGRTRAWRCCWVGMDCGSLPRV